MHPAVIRRNLPGSLVAVEGLRVAFFTVWGRPPRRTRGGSLSATVGRTRRFRRVGCMTACAPVSVVTTFSKTSTPSTRATTFSGSSRTQLAPARCCSPSSVTAGSTSPTGPAIGGSTTPTTSCALRSRPPCAAMCGLSRSLLAEHRCRAASSLRGLVRRQAIELSPNRFEPDVARLVRIIDKTLATVGGGPADAPAGAPVDRTSRWEGPATNDRRRHLLRGAGTCWPIRSGSAR